MMSPRNHLNRHVQPRRSSRARPTPDGSRRTTPPTLLVLLCLVLMAMAVGCRSETMEEESTLTIGVGAGEGGSSPLSALGGHIARFLMFLPLVEINERGELEGRLARSWALTDDSTWTIRIYSDARWHDGVPVTAHDIKFSTELRQHPEVLAWTPGSRTVTVLDDTTVTVAFRPGFGEEIEAWARTDIFPRHLLEGLDPSRAYGWEFWHQPIGNGPYRFVRYVPQTMYELEANPDFHLGRPRIERVILRRESTTAADLLSGNVDVSPTSNLAFAKQLAEDPRFRLYYRYRNSGRRHEAIAWNQDRYPPFSDRRVRRALTQAIDRRELLAVLNLPDFVPIYDVAMSNRQFRRGEFPDPVPYDPEAAKRLLEEAGWRDEDGDGVREKDGEEFRFTMVSGGNRLNMVTYVQEVLRRVGIAMEIEMTAVSSRTDVDARPIWPIGGRLRPGEMSIGGWLGPETPIGYRNPTVDSLIVMARETRLTLGELEGIFREMMPILQEDLPITFLYRGIGVWVVTSRLRGLSTPWNADPYKFAERLWLEDDP